MAAADLIGMVQALRAPYGLERSVKIMPGALAADRCLISLGRAALGPCPAEQLLRMTRALDMPSGAAQALPAALAGAEVVHFGYEAESGRETFKVYLEYVSQVRRAMAGPRRAPTLVHLAYKWVRGRPESCAVTRYTWVPCRNREELETRLHAVVPPTQAPEALRCALRLVARVAPLAETGELLLMDVEEPGNPRRSCDLNVYDAALRMRDIDDLLEATLTAFAVPQTQARAAFGACGGKALGHLSAGLARDGRQFVTFYFGVEAH